MKYAIKIIDASKWLNIINEEADPDIAKLEFNYYKLNGCYVAHLACGLGSFVSDVFTPTEKNVDKQVDKFFDKATEDLQKKYDERKGFFAPYAGFLARPDQPGIKIL